MLIKNIHKEAVPKLQFWEQPPILFLSLCGTMMFSMETLSENPPTFPGVRNRVLNAFFFFIMVSLLFAAVILLTDSEAELVSSPAQLENFDFSARIAILSPQLFERYPDTFYTPENFASGHISRPVPWGRDNPAHITYRLVLDNLTEGTIYGLSGLSATHAMSLWVDGVLLTQVGVPGDSRQTMIPRTNSFSVGFTAGPQPTEIIIQRSSFILYHGGRLNPLHLGEQQLILTMNTLGHVRVSVIIGITFMAALLYLGIFLFFRKQIQFFWFFVACIAVAFRTIGIDFRLMATLFPNMDWHIDYLIGYWSTSAFLVFMILYIDAVFQKPGINRVFKLVSVSVLSAHAVFILLTDTMIYSRLQIPYNITMVMLSTGLLINTTWILVRNSEKRRIEHILVLFGLAANVALGFVEAALRNATPQATANYTQVGTMIFLFVNAIALSLNFRRTENELAVVNEQRRRHEAAEIRLAAENAALDRVSRLRAELMETISHEARTPLAILSTYTSLVAREIQEKHNDPRITADLDKITSEAHRVANLIDSMKNLPLQKDREAQRLPLDLGELTTQTTALYHHILERSAVSLITDIPANLPPVLGNPEELTQVIFNLLQNSKNHTPDGGSITIKVAQTDEELRLSLTDTGTGISPELLPRVFERGVHGGTGSGVGLAVCKEIIEAHGGSIWIESSSARGTRVSFSLPTAVPEIEKDTERYMEENEDNEPITPHSGTILLVEDNPELNTAIRRLLELQGYTVHTAKTLASARKRLRETEPDIMILDVMLPDGNGIEWSREIRAKTQAHIIFLTAKVDEQDVVAGLASGGDDYMKKPFKTEELLARVQSAMRRREIGTPLNTIEKGRLTINLAADQAYVGSEDLLLSQKEFSVLCLLSQNEGKHLEAEQIYEAVWGRPIGNDKNAVRMTVSRLRVKLANSGCDISSERGKGYVFTREK